MSRILAILAFALLVAGCQPRQETPAPAPAEARSPAPSAAAAALTDSATALAALRRYYAAIEAHDYPTAYALWRDGGAASGQTADEFAHGFAETAHTAVEFTGPPVIEGAAGSIYATIPVRVRATTTAGVEQRFAGTYELRRVNDVPGATPEQLRWHIAGAKLAAEP